MSDNESIADVRAMTNMTLRTMNRIKFPDWAVPPFGDYIKYVEDGEDMVYTETEFLAIHAKWCKMVFRLDQKIQGNKPGTQKRTKVNRRKKNKMVEAEAKEWANQHDDDEEYEFGEPPPKRHKGKGKGKCKSKAAERRVVEDSDSDTGVKITKFIHKKTAYGPPCRSDEEEEDSSEDSDDDWSPKKNSKKRVTD